MSFSGDEGIFSDDDDTHHGGVSLMPESFVPTTPTGWEPERQPIGPPNELVVQKFAGFARFLKEHTSPRSKRVTAGGRIVPAGPNSPPPTFDMGFIDSIVKQSEASKSPRLSNATANLSLQGTASVNAKEGLNTKGGGTSQTSRRNSRANNGTNKAQGIANQGYESILGNSAAAIDPAIKLPAGASVYHVLNDGKIAFVGINGVSFRVHLTGDGQTSWEYLPPMNAYPAGFVPSGQGYFNNPSSVGFSQQPMMFPQGIAVGHSPQMIPQMMPQMFQTTTPVQPSDHARPADMNQAHINAAAFHHVAPQMQNVSMENVNSNASATNVPNHDAKNLQQLLDLKISLYKSRTDDLKWMERFLALNEQDLPAHELVAVLSRKKDLILEIDSLRKTKQTLERLLHGTESGSTNAAPNLNASRINEVNYGNTSHGFDGTVLDNSQTVPQPSTGSGASVPSTGQQGAKKPLSPMAPAFVPRSMGKEKSVEEKRVEEKKVEPKIFPIDHAGWDRVCPPQKSMFIDPKLIKDYDHYVKVFDESLAREKEEEAKAEAARKAGKKPGPTKLEMEIAEAQAATVKDLNDQIAQKRPTEKKAEKGKGKAAARGAKGRQSEKRNARRVPIFHFHLLLLINRSSGKNSAGKATTTSEEFGTVLRAKCALQTLITVALANVEAVQTSRKKARVS